MPMIPFYILQVKAISFPDKSDIFMQQLSHCVYKFHPIFIRFFHPFFLLFHSVYFWQFNSGSGISSKWSLFTASFQEISSKSQLLKSESLFDVSFLSGTIFAIFLFEVFLKRGHFYRNSSKISDCFGSFFVFSSLKANKDQ